MLSDQEEPSSDFSKVQVSQVASDATFIFPLLNV